METLGISKAEFMAIVSEIDTLFNSKYKDKQNLVHITFDYIYYAENYGHHDYLFYNKKINNENIHDWKGDNGFN